MNIDWNYLFTSTEGRIGRRLYWIGIGVLLVLHLLSYVLFGGGLVGIIARFVITLVGLAVMIKRCHDFGKTGWLALIAFIPVIGTLWIIALGFIPGESRANSYGLAAMGDAVGDGPSRMTGANEVRTDPLAVDPARRDETRDH